MKTNPWSVYLILISASVFAQEVTNPPAMAPAESEGSPHAIAPAAPETTNAPEAKPAPKKAAAKKPRHAHAKPAAAAELKTVPLVPGPAVVAASRVNVRGQARLNSEIVARMAHGDPVTVIEEIKLKHSGPEEPSAWAKIELPEKARVWVHASYIDPTNMTVLPKKLNMRGGPGENYSVLGTLPQGTVVHQVQTKGSWMQIDATTNAYAFMAAQYLTQEPAMLAEAAPTQPASVTEAPPAVEAATNVPAAPEPMPGTNEIASATNGIAGATNEMAAAPAPEEPPPPRIVQREGIVRYTASIQSPTLFELINAENHQPIDYLYTTSTNLDLNRYKGLRIIVTGEEGLDERWKHTPIITIQRIQVVD